jgi:6,7-dimethyl-8-ribityllumazine synthase
MSREGAPELSSDGTGLRVGVVASMWHTTVMDGLLAGSLSSLARSNVTDVEVMRVPGTFELPLGAASMADEMDAVVALGVVIRGGTPHFDYVCRAATDGLLRVTLDSRTPIGFGVLTCDDEQQALDRAGLPESHENKGAEAAAAAVSLAVAIRDRVHR